MGRRWFLTLFAIALTAFLLWTPDARAYPTYRDGDDQNCSGCHSGFVGGFSGPLHSLHLTATNDCTACHTSPGSTPVPTKFVPGEPGGCSGCHVVDGVVAHHTNAGAPPDGNGLSCATCHPSVNPGPESDIPPYYSGGTAELSSLDPCDADGLDNDGDLLYDMDDPDCVVAAEDCFNEVDDDGDDLIDCADPDCDGAVGDMTTCGVGACAGNTGQFECQGGELVNTCNPLGGAAADDTLCNGTDDDCDGSTDEDYVTTTTTCGVGECAAEGLLECVDGDELNSCTPGDPGVEGPFGDASCEDGLDNDCDEATDAADPDCQATAETDCFDGVDNDQDGSTDCADTDCDGAAGDATTCGVGACEGNTGQFECQGGELVDTCDPFGGAAADDTLCNGTDDDCDGSTDEDFVATPTTCGVGECAAEGLLECADGQEVDSCTPGEPGVEGPFGDASCEDGLDNDCDEATDDADPDCQAGAETDCFDGVDNDQDQLPDCADPDCDGAAGDATTCGVGACEGNTGQFECQGGDLVDTCDPFGGAAADDTLCNGTDDDCDGSTDEDFVATPTTCGVGECAAEGLLECADGQEVDSCTPGEPGVEGPFGDTSCEDVLDNDCDEATDDADPDCQEAAETDCFDGVDNDQDQLTDCVDPDCEGALNGTCDTSQMGICAAGTITCINGEPVCTQDMESQPEGNMYNNCNDGLDNDCDGFADVDDTDCDMMMADVWLQKLIAHNKVNLEVGDSRSRRVFAMARADTKWQDATVTLTAEAPEGVTVMIDPDTITRPIGPYTKNRDDGSKGRFTTVEMLGDNPLFKFFPVITCNEPGAFTVNYTAEITAPENRTMEGDVATATTVVHCKKTRSRRFQHVNRNSGSPL